MPCAVETSKIAAELTFWRELYQSAGHEVFAKIRKLDFEDYASNLPEIRTQEGRGLDLCCGPWSIFEGCGFDVIGADALHSKYLEIMAPPCRGMFYEQQDGEAMTFPDAYFDYVWLVNAIDHTPNPEKLLAEVRRALKPGGRFYFGVWFDPALGTPHYRLWNRATVDEYLKGFKLIRATEEWWVEHRKFRYWAIYE